MDVITMQDQAFKSLVEKIEILADYVMKQDALNSDKKKMDIWLDSLEVSALLNISTRTLQRLRKENAITYHMLRGRCLYKFSDIEDCLNKRIIKSDSKSIEDFHQNYINRCSKGQYYL
ncbi:MAG: helix-turn-helix domain-containing protein [Tannerellaceae bacterium]|nr:helix-turn-helix domain-containing protein [Tannerellaceae bacterium]